MENKTFMMPPIGGKSILRSTGEEVEIIAFHQPNDGMRTESKDLTFEQGDWVTYIDSEGNEHIKEHLNMQLDFKPQTNDLFQRITESPVFKRIPTERNRRIYELAKELFMNGHSANVAVSEAATLVDAVGIEFEEKL